MLSDHPDGPDIKVYEVTHVKTVAAELDVYQADVDAQVPGADAELEAFIVSRMAQLELALQHAKICRRWAKYVSAYRRTRIKSRQAA